MSAFQPGGELPVSGNFSTTYQLAVRSMCEVRSVRKHIRNDPKDARRKRFYRCFAVLYGLFRTEAARCSTVGGNASRRREDRILAGLPFKPAYPSALHGLERRGMNYTENGGPQQTHISVRRS